MNRGVSKRRITSLREITFCRATPTFVSGVTARAVARHVVRLSGKRNFTVARPSAPVIAFGSQYAVSLNSLRISGWTTSLSFLKSANWYDGLVFARSIGFSPANPVNGYEIERFVSTWL